MSSRTRPTKNDTLSVSFIRKITVSNAPYWRDKI